jgi:CHAD domain-containing protein
LVDRINLQDWVGFEFERDGETWEVVSQSISQWVIAPLHSARIETVSTRYLVDAASRQLTNQVNMLYRQIEILSERDEHLNSRIMERVAGGGTVLNAE